MIRTVSTTSAVFSSPEKRTYSKSIITTLTCRGLGGSRRPVQHKPRADHHARVVNTDANKAKEMTMANQQPTYQAYTVVKREGQDDFWLNIGAGFEHQDGKGINILLQALPIDGKVVLRPPKDSTDERPAERDEPRNNRSQSNNRGRRS